MSLRFKLNLFISLLFLSLFIASGFYIISDARDAVQREVESSARLALQLLQLIIEPAGQAGAINSQQRLLDNLSQMDEIRHLHFEILGPGNVITPVKKVRDATASEAPGWYVDLVKPPPIEIKRWFYNPLLPTTGIIVHADPYDEIDENWNEVSNSLFLLLVFICLANLLVYVVAGRNLSPLKTISDALQTIEKGDYQLELPGFRLPELDQLSKRFNNMSRVLQKSREKNQWLTQRSLQMQEEERRRLAQEIHDELGQTITAIKAVAIAIRQDTHCSPEQLSGNVDTIVEYSDHIYSVAKNMMQHLRPSILDEFGLVKALQHLVDEWNGLQDDVFCHFTFSNMPENLPETIRISLFRIVQEGLTNVIKHARASDVSIALRFDPRRQGNVIQLSMIDNGRGMDMVAVKPGMGLLGMRERVEMLDGEFRLDSSKLNGLQIEICIPFMTKEEGDAAAN